MGRGIVNQSSTVEGVSAAGSADKCDVCGRQRDVAQIVCTMEGPDPEIGGLANLVYICTFCCARAIQAVTGFRAVRQLKSWYLVRDRHPNLDGLAVQKLADGDDWIG